MKLKFFILYIVFYLNLYYENVDCSLTACMYGYQSDDDKPCFCHRHTNITYSGSASYSGNCGKRTYNICEFQFSQVESKCIFFLGHVENVFKLACGYSNSDIKRNITYFEESSFSRALSKCRQNAEECDILMSVGVTGIPPENSHGYPMVTTSSVGSMSIIHTDNKRESWRIIIDNFTISLTQAYPVFILTLMLAMLSGIIVWMLDTFFNKSEFPRSFLIGPYEGFWWSFVSMTTVGYGDKAPKGLPARIYSLFFIVIGIAVIGVLTSILSNALSEAMTPDTPSLQGETIGVINSAYGELIAHIGATTKSYSNYEALEKSIAHGYIQAFAYDTPALRDLFDTRLINLNVEWLLMYQNQTFSRSGMLFPKTGDHPSIYPCEYEYGTCATKPQDCSNHFLTSSPQCCAYHMPENLTNCFKVYWDYQRIDKNPYILASHYLKKEYFELPGASSSFSVVDTDSWEFKMFALACGMITACILLLLVLCEFIFNFKKHCRDDRIKTNDGYEMDKLSAFKTTTAEDICVTAHLQSLIEQSEKRIQETEKLIRKDIMETQRELRRNLSNMRAYDSNLRMVNDKNIYYQS